jgi:hypothetical protein
MIEENNYTCPILVKSHSRSPRSFNLKQRIYTSGNLLFKAVFRGTKAFGLFFKSLDKKTNYRTASKVGATTDVVVHAKRAV